MLARCWRSFPHMGISLRAIRQAEADVSQVDQL
jgi:hypothetical protein